VRAVIQRVNHSEVTIEGREVGRIGLGLMILLGVAHEDTEDDARYLAGKCAEMRIFEDASGKMNLSVKDVQGQILVVSQFTLLADCRRGRRPSFVNAAPPQEANRLYEFFVSELRNMGLIVATGEFGAMMDVSLTNIGPVTILLDTMRNS
jgi:D-aminoacyl-tRNA deacylase